MENNTIYIAGFFDEESESQLNEVQKELQSIDISLQKHNRSGEIYHSIPELMDIEVVVLGYEILRTFIMNGSYDVFKYYILRHWNIIQKKTADKRQFTITIEGIPTTTGLETIKCKMSGIASKRHKEMVIDKVFDLAKRVEADQTILLEKDQFYNALNGHIFRYDAANKEFKEIDFLKEVAKAKNQKEN